MSTAEVWLEFEEAWLARLKQNGLTYFHRSELNIKNHPGLLEDLAHIVRDHAMRKFGMVVRVNALHTLVPKQLYEGWHMDAYSYAGRACVSHVRLWAESEHLRNMPELVFATGDTGRNALEKGLKQDGFLNVQFKPAKDEINKKNGFVDAAAVPLQAADLFAYELFYPIRDIESSRIRREEYTLTPLQLILDKVPGEPHVTEDATFEFFEEKMRYASGAGSDRDSDGLLSNQRTTGR
jgi:hypothetical protein